MCIREMKIDMDALFENWRKRIESLIQEHPLQLISWEATRRCNLKCVHCGSPSEEVDLGEELSADEVVRAFEQIAEDFDMSQFRHINITGGEPFVREDLLEVLRRINRYPSYRNIDIQTNGIILAQNPELFSVLNKCGVTGLGVSIDGLEQTHDAFRRIRGGFVKAFNAARLGVEHGYTVTVSVVAHKKNIEEISELYELVKNEIKPRIFRIMTIDPIGRTECDSKDLLEPEQVRQVIDFLKTQYRQSCPDYADQRTTMVELGCGGWLGKELEGTIRPFIFHCIAGINNLGILYDGKLASCSNISREFIEGDLKKDRIKDVWENCYQRYRDFEWKKTGQCLNCEEWDCCHGGPMHIRHNDDKPLMCMYNLMGTQC